MTPDEIGLVAQLAASGMPTVAVIAFWKIWNGTSKRMEKMAESLESIDRRLLKIEIQGELREKEHA